MNNIRQAAAEALEAPVLVFDTFDERRQKAVRLAADHFETAQVESFSDNDELLSYIEQTRPALLITAGRQIGSTICAVKSRYNALPILLVAPSELSVDTRRSIGRVRILPPEFGRRELRSAFQSLMSTRSTPFLVAEPQAIPTAELIQVLIHIDFEGTVHISAADGALDGQVGIVRQRVVDARAGEESGIDALLKMSEWKQCSFECSPDLPEQRTQSSSSTELAELFSAGGDRDDNTAFESERVRTNPNIKAINRIPVQSTGPGDRGIDDASPPTDLPGHPTEASDVSDNHNKRGELTMANNVKATLKSLSDIDGFIAAALVDAESGMSLGTLGGGNDFDIDVAAAANTDVVKAKMNAVHKLELESGIEDILITLGDQYHLIRPLDDRPHIFFYLALDRSKSNLAMARMSVKDAEGQVEL